jgi:hypothetical protein
MAGSSIRKQNRFDLCRRQGGHLKEPIQGRTVGLISVLINADDLDVVASTREILHEFRSRIGAAFVRYQNDTRVLCGGNRADDGAIYFGAFVGVKDERLQIVGTQSFQNQARFANAWFADDSNMDRSLIVAPQSGTQVSHYVLLLGTGDEFLLHPEAIRPLAMAS